MMVIIGHAVALGSAERSQPPALGDAEARAA